MKNENLKNLLKTPYKFNRLVIEPSYKAGEFDSHAVDCPSLFYHNGAYCMTYIGFDGIGYRTGLATSCDLVNWHKRGMILDRGPEGSITQYNAALNSILRDNELFSPANLKKVSGRYIGTYHTYPQPGYECGPGVIGLCFSEDLKNWEIGDLILEPDPGCPWEAGGLYKSWLLESENIYYLFYNAKNNSQWPWIEQIGVAVSNDLVNWTRHPGNPILKVGKTGAFDDLFASDPCILKHKDNWLMFYFGNSSDGHARDSVAVSKDLLNWKKTEEVLIDVGNSGSIDSLYAHKPGIITKEKTLYHFYCAVSLTEGKQVRGISFAANEIIS